MSRDDRVITGTVRVQLVQVVQLSYCDNNVIIEIYPSTIIQKNKRRLITNNDS